MFFEFSFIEGTTENANSLCQFHWLKWEKCIQLTNFFNNKLYLVTQSQVKMGTNTISFMFVFQFLILFTFLEL